MKESDSDGDGLTDKLEIDGWKIVIFEEKDGSTISEYYEESDPNDPDTEDDGLSDFDEYVHGSDPEKANTDGDYQNDFDEVNGESGSTPTGKDGIPPIIVNLEYEIQQKYDGIGPLKAPTGFKVEFLVECEDIDSYVTYITVNIKGIEKHTETFDDCEISKYEYDFEFGYGRGIKNGILKSGLDIEIIASDVDGNVGEIDFETESILDVIVMKAGIALSNVIDISSDIFNMIKETISNIIVEIFKPQLEKMIQSIPENEILSVIDTIKWGIISFHQLIFRILKVILESIMFIVEFIVEKIYVPILNAIFGELEIFVTVTEIMNLVTGFVENLLDEIDEVFNYLKNTKSISLLDDALNLVNIFEFFDVMSIFPFRNRLINVETNEIDEDKQVEYTDSNIDTILFRGDKGWNENDNWKKIMKQKYSSNIIGDYKPGNFQKSDVDKIFTNLMEKNNTGRTLLLFISLHGNKGEFILPTGEILTANELNNYLEQLDFHQIYLVIDSCYSGSSLNILKSSSDLVIVSSDSDELSLGRISKLMSVILSEVDTKILDINFDGQVGLDEVYYYILDNNINGIENPEIYISNGYSNTLISKQNEINNIDISLSISMREFISAGATAGTAAGYGGGTAISVGSVIEFCVYLTFGLLMTTAFKDINMNYRYPGIFEELSDPVIDALIWLIDGYITIHSRIYEEITSEEVRDILWNIWLNHYRGNGKICDINIHILRIIIDPVPGIDSGQVWVRYYPQGFDNGESYQDLIFGTPFSIFDLYSGTIILKLLLYGGKLFHYHETYLWTKYNKDSINRYFFLYEGDNPELGGYAPIYPLGGRVSKYGVQP